MTSMYWYSESVKAKAADWRPEIHDSDGLAIWAGTGEHLWRPLINPPILADLDLPGRDAERASA